MYMEAMGRVFDETGGQRKNHSSEVLEIINICLHGIMLIYYVERPLLKKCFLVRRRVHDWRKSVPQRGRLLHSLLLSKFIME